jgi:hypothetical protein
MTTEFTDQALPGARFERVDLTGATFEMADLRGVRFRGVNLSGAKVTGSFLSDVDISGDVVNLRVNGVDVAPLVEAELDRRHPERLRLRPTDADGFRAAWVEIERLWGETVDRARGLEPALLHERVDGEWSFVETLRHLVFATDAWVLRAVLGEPAPWHPLDLPHDEMSDIPGVPRDRDARPPLDEVLALRADRMATVRGLLADLTDERLVGSTEPVPGPGYPEPESYPVREVLMIILNEEWWHRLYAERDLAALA